MPAKFTDLPSDVIKLIYDYDRDYKHWIIDKHSRKSIDKFGLMYSIKVTDYNKNWFIANRSKLSHVDKLVILCPLKIKFLDDFKNIRHFCSKYSIRLPKYTDSMRYVDVSYNNIIKSIPSLPLVKTLDIRSTKIIDLPPGMLCMKKLLVNKNRCNVPLYLEHCIANLEGVIVANVSNLPVSPGLSWTNQQGQIQLYATNYNAFRVLSGMGGLAYSN
jgi:hypothetical protein